ncbi:hypothetical protein PSAC2689_80090 [Paraburkholderia sacchari]
MAVLPRYLLGHQYRHLRPVVFDLVAEPDQRPPGVLILVVSTTLAFTLSGMYSGPHK